jgi:tetratricopeptide (TPR) repeat protein
LVAFQELVRVGNAPPPEQFCPPELLPEFLRRLATLERLAPMLAAPEVLAPAPSLPGYEILSELGRGGMGVVYHARQTALNRPVALKMILAGVHAGPNELARFRAEAEAVARLRHPNVVDVYDFGTHDGLPYFSMAYLPGGSLADRLKGEPQPPAYAAETVERLARAAQEAHSHGIVHRDLKPANVLLDADGTPKVSDFGLAKLLDTSDGPRTATNAILGTPIYMAPEQAAGRASEVGPAADVYALGVMLYEMLTGRVPIRGATSRETLTLIGTVEPVPVRELRPGVPRDLDTIALKCLEKPPEQRYASAGELADDLRRFLDGRPILARPPGVWYQARKFVGRNRALVAGTAAVLLTVVMGMAGVAAAVVRADREKARADLAERDRELRAAAAEQDRFAMLAQRSTQRGDWNGSLDLIERALAAGHPDPNRLRLEKVKALLALDRTDAARGELDELLARDDLGGLTASVLLWGGDVLLGHDNDEAVRRIGEALRRGLSDPADAAYAAGLLAPTAPGAVRHFEEVLRLEPAHPRAGSLLALTLIALGRTDEARRCVALAKAFRPDDASLSVLEAVAASATDDRTAADAALAHVRSNMGDAAGAAVKMVIEVLDEVRSSDALAGDDPAVDALIAKLAPKFLRAGLGLPGVPRFAAGDLFHGLRLPPLLAASFGKLAPVFFRGHLETLVPALQEATRVLPEGSLHYTLGRIYATNADRMREAEAAFRKAHELPSLIPVRRAARECHIRALWTLRGRMDTPSDEAAELSRRALEQIRALFAENGLTPGNASDICVMAATLGDMELARRLVIEYRRMRPDDTRPKLFAAHLNLKAGHFGSAAEQYRAILASEPMNKEALKRLAEAEMGFREQYRKLFGGE